MKILLREKVLLFLICLLTLLLYLPTLSYYPEGDDFLFLWHIRVPVNFLQIPFYGWEEPVAGRFGYGQAWYGAAVAKIFGSQPYIFNLFGIFFKIVALLAVYTFAKKLTKNKYIPLISAFLFAILSTGANGEISLFLHFSLIFMAIFLYGTALFTEGLETKNFLKVIIGSTLLLLGNYLYIIRGAGIVLLPFLIFLRNIPIKSKSKLIYFICLAILVVLLSAVVVTKLIPGADNYASITLINNSVSIFNSTRDGHYEYLRAGLLSIGLMLFNRDFYNLFDQLFQAANNLKLYLLIWSPLIWTLLYALFVFPLYCLKRVSNINLLLGYGAGICWNLLLRLLYHERVVLFIGGEVVSATIGIEIVLLMIILGLFYLKFKPELGSTLIAVIATAIFFYIPNWLHDPIIASATESRYFTVSSGFVAIGLSILIYILFSQLAILKQVHRFKLMSGFLAASSLISLLIVFTHWNYLNNIIFQNGIIRNSTIISSHWNFVKSRVNFTKRPLIVNVWADAQIDSAKREFFRHQSLGLIGNIPWDYQLTDTVRLYYSMEDAVQAICGWKNHGIAFNPENLYEFKLTADRKIVDRSKEGRNKLNSWKDYCLDPHKKGLEVNN